MAAAHGISFLDLVIRKDRPQGLAPVHRCLALIRYPVLHKDGSFLLLIKCIPLLCRERINITACRIDRRAASLTERSHKFLDRTCLSLGIVIPASEHLKECPLCPFVILRLTGAHLT